MKHRGLDKRVKRYVKKEKDVGAFWRRAYSEGWISWEQFQLVYNSEEMQ